jgi:hypothetical protein
MTTPQVCSARNEAARLIRQLPQNNSSAILVQNKTLNGKDFDVPPRSKVIGRDSTISLVTEALANPTLGHKACLLGIRGIGLVARLWDR